MMRTPLRVLMALSIAACCGAAVFAAPAPEAAIVWAGEDASLPVDLPDGEVKATLRVLTPAGWQPAQDLALPVRDKAVTFRAPVEGIGALKLDGLKSEQRFVVLAPPAPVDAAALHRTLPQKADALLSGKPFTIMAMGDSVTTTGDYPRFLAAMLSRATGNTQIKAIKKGYAGKSIDASVRNFPNDTAETKPDLAIIMYGLNDQIVNVPMDAYYQQLVWLTLMLQPMGSDVMFMTSTPHIDTGEAGGYPWFAARTVPYAARVRETAGHLKVPVVDGFNAIWMGVGPGPEKAYAALQPMYPPNYGKQLETLMDTGKGDTIHPNALGHLLLARAAYDTLNGRDEVQPVTITAQTTWDASGPFTRVTLANRGSQKWAGQCELIAPMRTKIEQQGERSVELAPGETRDIIARWPDVKSGEDLKRPPYNEWMHPQYTTVAAALTSDGKTRIVGVPARWPAGTDWERPMFVMAHKPFVPLRFFERGVESGYSSAITCEGDVGQAFLETKIGDTPYVMHVRYTRFAGALAGNATVDGDLAEWADHIWTPMGNPIQARNHAGPQDNRPTPEAFMPEWSMKAGNDGIFFALRARGEPIDKDGMTLWFDTRTRLLGHVGPYWWIDVKMLADGKTKISYGESTQKRTGAAAFWRKSGDYSAVELFIPYAAIATDAWPKSGDLGVSVSWGHTGADGKPSGFMWSEDSHPWNTRHYGVVRLQKTANREELPWKLHFR